MALLLTAGMLSCQQTGGLWIRDPKSIEQVEHERREALKKIDRAKCEQSGGVIKNICMFSMPACVIPFSDAGKECNDKSQCQGMCLLDLSKYDRMPVVGSTATGICQKDSDVCGCTVEILEGKVQQGICAD